MCKTCWKEFGGHSHTSEQIQQAVKLIHIIYDEQESGLPLHTYLDDWGIDRTWEPYEPHKTDVSETVWKAAEELCQLMNEMSLEDRCAAMAHASGFVNA